MSEKPYAFTRSACARRPIVPRRRRIPERAIGPTAQDLIARVAGEVRLGQPFVIENRPGAGGNIAAEVVAKSPPDGYTIIMTTNTHLITPSLLPKLPYDPIRDFAPVALLVAFSVIAQGATIPAACGDLATALDVWKGHDAVVVIDAMRSGGRPGTIVRLRAHERALPLGFARSSTHSFGLAEVVELGRAMQALPASVIVYGIEGKSFALGEGLSPEVEPAVGEVVECVLREVGDRA